MNLINFFYFIGSLAKGTDDQVRSLIDYNIVRIFLNLISTQNVDKRLIEYCLCALKSIFQYPFAPVGLLYSNIGTLTHLISKWWFFNL